jgi:hypothetical protein
MICGLLVILASWVIIEAIASFLYRAPEEDDDDKNS